MPGITAIRIAGLKVGRDRDKLHDCTFKTGLGEGSNGNTLVNLVNGGGKSTMILAIEQVFKPCTYRSRLATEQNAINNIADLLNKPRDHYFALVEFALDDGAEVSPEENRLVAGIAMRHKAGAPATGATRDRVDYYTFISVYGSEQGAQNSIENLPLVEYDGDGKSRLATYDVLTGLAKTEGFEVFGGNPQATKRYLDALEAYGVPARTLAKAYALVGTTESGIGEWAKKEITTVEKLMDYLISVVVQKQDFDTGDLSSTVVSYAGLYETKKDDERKRAAAQDAEPLLASLVETSDRLVDAHVAVDEAALDIDAFVAACAEKVSELEKQCVANEERQHVIDEELRDLAFQEKSYEYFKAHAKAESLFAESDAKQVDWKRTADELSTARHRERVLKCAKVEGQLRSSEKEIARIEGVIESLESKGRASERLADLKYATKRAALRERAEVQARLRELGERIDDSSRDLDAVRNAWKTTDESLMHATTEHVRLEGSLEAQRIELERRFAAAGMPFSTSLDGRVSTVVVKHKRIEAETSLAKLAAESDELSNAQESVQKELAGKRTEHGAAQATVETSKRAYLAAREAHSKCTDSLEECFEACDKACVDARSYGLAWAQEDIEDKSARHHDEKRALEDELRNLRRMLVASKDKTLHLSAEAREWFDAHGIGYTTGEARYSSCSDNVKRGILANHPEMLYGVVLDDAQYAAFERSAKEGWQQSLVPVYRQSEVIALSQDGKEETATFLALPNVEALSNPEGFEHAMQSRLVGVEERKVAVENHLHELECARRTIERHAGAYDDEDGRAVERFADKRDKARNEYNDAKEREAELAATVTALEKELSRLSERLDGVKCKTDEQSRLLEEMQEAEDKADVHNAGLSELEESGRKVNDLRSSVEKLGVRKARLESELNSAKDSHRAAEERRSVIETTLEEVGDAAERDTVLDGKSDLLLEEYVAMRDAESAKIKDQKEALKGAKQLHKARLETLAACAHNDETAIAEGREVYDSASEKKIEQELDSVTKEALSLAKTVEEKQFAAMKASNDANKAQGIVDSLHGQINEEFGKEPEVPNDFTAENAALRKEELTHEKEALKDEAERQSAQVKMTSRAENDAAKKRSSLFSEFKTAPCTERRAMNLEDNVFAQKDRLEIKAEKELDRLERETKTASKLFERYEECEFAQTYVADAARRLKEGLAMVKSTVQAKSLKRMFEDNARAVERLVETLNVELGEIDNGFNDLVDAVQLRQQVVYDELQQIERHSRVRFEGDATMKTTLQLNLPERSVVVEGETARKRVRDFLESLVRQIVDEPNQSAREKKAKYCMSASSLFSVAVPLGSLKVKKLQGSMERERRRMIPWSGGLSGAENMLAAAIVLTASMDYLMSTDVSTARRPRAVLVLDNPYGEASSKSLLDPFYSLCEQTKTQIIAFSDHSTQEITSGISSRYTLVRRKDMANNMHIVLDERTTQHVDAEHELESASYHARRIQATRS